MSGLSRETLEFFHELLGQVRLAAGDPAFEEQAERIVRVRRELTAALDETKGGAE